MKDLDALFQSWHRHWPKLITIFDYPDDIRKAIFTTNAIESLNYGIFSKNVLLVSDMDNKKLASFN